MTSHTGICSILYDYNNMSYSSASSDEQNGAYGTINGAYGEIKSANGAIKSADGEINAADGKINAAGEEIQSANGEINGGVKTRKPESHEHWT